MQKSPKKKSKRSSTKYPALTRNLNLKTRQYYIEPDYINGVGDIRALTDKEKEFLNKFYEEYINSSFNKDGKDLHKTDEKRRELYRQNNQRNNCLYNFKQTHGELKYFNEDYYDKIFVENYGYLDFEDLYTNEFEAKEIAKVTVEMVEKLNNSYSELVEIIKTRFPEYFYRNFSEKELKRMKLNEIGETLYKEAKILLE